MWAAGVTASGLASALAELTGAELDRAGRVTVEADLTPPGHPRSSRSATWSASVAATARRRASRPGAGGHAAGALRGQRRPRTPATARAPPPFRYHDKGNLATIGRAAAVADIKGFKLSGLIAWLTWLVVHLFYLVGFQNRLLVFIRWSIDFATRGRGARLITDTHEGRGTDEGRDAAAR